MKKLNKVIVWSSPLILLINMIILYSSSVILSLDLSKFHELKYSFYLFSIFITPIMLVLYVVSIFNYRKNKWHSSTAMTVIMAATLIANAVSFPFSYHYFYKNDSITIATFILSSLLGLYVCWVLYCNKKNLA